jgi:two-component system, OmpR family, phosphate regulon sensor histidine kinase PhoR
MRSRFLSNFLAVYMMLAFAWWAVHLLRENVRLRDARIELLEYRFLEQKNNGTLMQLLDYQAIQADYRRRIRMVASEGLFFVGCLVTGLWIIRRSAMREVVLARQRRNFLLSITHELKSPIAAMRLVFDTFARRELTREQTVQLTTNGLRDATRLQSLVEDMLLAARLEDQWHPSIEPIALAGLVQDCVGGLRVRFPDSNVEIDLPADLPPIRADKSGLTSVVQNLLENALKYSPPGSPVRLSAAPLPAAKMRIEVADQGQGIPESERSAVFEKFYRLGNEETRRATGTGLGLYIVRQVVDAHRGSISIRDNTPRGTVFSIEM